MDYQIVSQGYKITLKFTVKDRDSDGSMTIETAKLKYGDTFQVDYDNIIGLKNLDRYHVDRGKLRSDAIKWRNS
jgi:hypothetical protein